MRVRGEALNDDGDVTSVSRVKFRVVLLPFVALDDGVE